MRDRRRRAVTFSVLAVLGCSILLANAVDGAVRRVSPETARAAAWEGRLPSHPPAPLYAPGQLLVRFADSVLSPAEAVFARHASFAEHTADRSTGLDELFRRFGVRGVHPIVREPVRMAAAIPAAKDLRAADEAAQSSQVLRFAVSPPSQRPVRRSGPRRSLAVGKLVAALCGPVGSGGDRLEGGLGESDATLAGCGAARRQGSGCRRDRYRSGRGPRGSGPERLA